MNDTQFTDALLTYLENNYCLDTGRLFASGMSNGGGFTGGVAACDPNLSTRFAAFGPHSGALYTGTLDNGNCQPYTVLTNTIAQSVCSPGRKNVPMIEFHGDTDGTIGYFGGGRRSYCLPAIPHWATDW